MLSLSGYVYKSRQPPADVHSIVEKHGGTVSAQSEPEEGSTFSFTLPVIQLGACGRGNR